MRYGNRTFSRPGDVIIPANELENLLTAFDVELYTEAVRELNSGGDASLRKVLIDMSRHQLAFSQILEPILPSNPLGVYSDKTGELILSDEDATNKNIVFVSEHYPGIDYVDYVHNKNSSIEDIKKGSGYLKLISLDNVAKEDNLDVPAYMHKLFRASLCREAPINYWTKEAMVLGTKIALNDCNYLTLPDDLFGEIDYFLLKYKVNDDAVDVFEVNLNKASRVLADSCRKALLGFGVDIYGDFKGRVSFMSEKYSWNGTAVLHDDIRITDWANMTITRLNNVMLEADKDRYTRIVQSFYM